MSAEITLDEDIAASARLRPIPARCLRKAGLAEPLLAREADGRAFRLIGIGAYDLVEVGQAPQADLFDADPGDEDLDDVLDELRERIGHNAFARGRGFGAKLARQGASKVE